MSWWSTRSSRWTATAIARIGGGQGLGGLLLGFRSADVPAAPILAVIPGGPGVGDSPQAGWMRSGTLPGLISGLRARSSAAAPVTGSFAMQDIQGRGLVLRGKGQNVTAECAAVFSMPLPLAPDLPRIGLPVFDLWPIYGSQGAPVDGFSGTIAYVAQ